MVSTRTDGFIGDEFLAKGWILPHEASIAQVDQIRAIEHQHRRLHSRSILRIFEAMAAGPESCSE